MMSLPLSIIAFALLALLGASIVLTRRRSRLDPQLAALYPNLVHLSRVTLGWRYLGAGLALIVGFGGIGNPTGRVSLLMPAVAAGLVIICQSIGEAISFRNARTPGVASLERRKLTGWLPGRLLIGSGIALVAWLALVIIGWHFSAADGQSWTMELVATHRTADGRQVTSYFGSQSGSPFYGWFYSVPVIWATAALLVLAGIGVLLVAHRPRNGSDSTLSTWDDALRRRSIRGIVLALLSALSANVAVAAAGLTSYHITNAFVDPDTGLPVKSVVSPQGGYGLHWLASTQAHQVLIALAVLGAIGFCLAAGALLGDSSPVYRQKTEIGQPTNQPAMPPLRGTADQPVAANGNPVGETSARLATESKVGRQ